MNKQDVYDIIQLLDNHYQSHKMEVRSNVLFRFENDDSDWFEYDNKYLWWTSDENDQDIFQDEVNDNLEVSINLDYHYDDNNLINVLESRVFTNNFLLKCVKYIQQEFDIDLNKFQYEDGYINILVKNNSIKEGFKHIKKYNQFND